MPPEAEPVFQRLRAWRAATAREENKAPFIIFHDSTLRQIATIQPSTLDDLATISGVGEQKLAKYGQAVLNALATE